MSFQGPAGALSAHRHPMQSRCARRPFSNAYGLQRLRTSLRSGRSTDVQRVHAKVQEDGVDSMEDRKVSSESASSSGLSGLVNNLLFGAATSLERGDATCAQCRGTGLLKCTVCKGAGIMKQKVRMNQLRHAMNKVKVLVGMEGAGMYDTQWQMSNRCRKCHGQGTCLCPTCGGLGARGPQKGRRASMGRIMSK